MNYTEPFLRKVETAQEEQQHQHPQHQHQSGVSYRAAVAANNTLLTVHLQTNPDNWRFSKCEQNRTIKLIIITKY